jgi:hypothetical protein
MQTTEKTTIEKLKSDFLQKLNVEWESKWRPEFKYPFPKDFKKINLHGFVASLEKEMNEAVATNSKINNKKDALIGTQTLKRFLEEPQKSTNFQLTTKNCIACYLGFDSWENYLLHFENNKVKNQKNEPDILFKDLKLEGKGWFANNKILLFSILILALLLGLYFIFKPIIYNIRKYPENVPLKILNATNNGIAPTQLTFCYDLRGLTYDSAYLKYDDKKIAIVKQMDTIQYTYVHPSLKPIKIKLDTVEYYFLTPVKAENWLCSFANGPNMDESKFKKKGFLHVNEMDVPKEMLATKDYYTFYHRLADFGIDGDSLSFETRVKNPHSEGGISCYDVSISAQGEINGKETYLAFNLLHPSCTQYAHVVVGKTDIGFNGKEPPKPLTPFGINIDDWTTVKYLTKNKIFYVYVNGTLIYTLPYEGTIGQFRMLQIEFKGSGSIDYVKMSNSTDGKVKFFEGF